MQITQAKLTHNIEYQLEDRWVKVPQGTVVNFCEETQTACVANENELFHCANEHVEPVSKFFLVPAPMQQAIARTN